MPKLILEVNGSESTGNNARRGSRACAIVGHPPRKKPNVRRATQSRCIETASGVRNGGALAISNYRIQVPLRVGGKSRLGQVFRHDAALTSFTTGLARFEGGSCLRLSYEAWTASVSPRKPLQWPPEHVLAVHFPANTPFVVLPDLRSLPALVGPRERPRQPLDSTAQHSTHPRPSAQLMQRSTFPRHL